MSYRIEHDSMGEVLVPSDKYWGAQTQRSIENFKIGTEKMPTQIIDALCILKLGCARANSALLPHKMTKTKLDGIEAAIKKISDDKMIDNFPLSVWQTGSGTQTNMNVNEVIANLGNEILGGTILHPNDDVNMSQSSNDTFPTAMHISAVLSLQGSLLPSLESLIGAFKTLERENEGIIKCGRTHLQDATPISFSQEISAWRSSLEYCREMILSTLDGLKRLCLGATAVGTGLNAPLGFGELAASEISKITGVDFTCEQNKFHALSSKSEIAFAHSALRALACELMKIANDIRWLASGPRLGLGEIKIPENEPGSSIMPGKVNPTQCEAVTMVAVRVMGNDTTVGMCASQGNFQLNVFMPVCIYSFLQSVTLLTDVMSSFEKNCVRGIKANGEKMKDNLNRSLMLVTALSPYIGYESCAKVAKLAHERGITLKEACLELKLLSAEEFDKYFRPEEMV